MGKSGIDDNSYFEKFDPNFELPSFIGWRAHITYGLTKMFLTDEIRECINAEHTKNTPERFIKALDEYFAGCFVDPTISLRKTLFKRQGPHSMIHVGDVQFYSMCAHHLAPIVGKVHFAYIPSTQNNHIVGLSKIPRLIEDFARRPQVQEQLTDNIVDVFEDVVKPAGCAALIRASHFCMSSRGIKAHGAVTTTTSLRGNFTDGVVRQEFLAEASRLEWRIG